MKKYVLFASLLFASLNVWASKADASEQFLRVKNYNESTNPYKHMNFGPTSQELEKIFLYETKQGEFIWLNRGDGWEMQPGDLCDGTKLEVRVRVYDRADNLVEWYNLGRQDLLLDDDEQDRFFYFRPGLKYKIHYSLVNFPEATCHNFAYKFVASREPLGGAE